MRREPSLTFKGALEILGHREHRAIERLDKLLGGVILAAGTGAGLAAVGPAAIAPLGAFAAVWGWLEQRDEAVRLLRAAVDSACGKLSGTGAYERLQLIAAAHTTVVVASFFEALEDVIGAQELDRLRITDADKQMLAAGRERGQGESLYDLLYATEIPAPSPVRGFEENCTLVSDYLRAICFDFSEEILNAEENEGVDDWINCINWSDVGKRALRRYRSRYLQLAAVVPEFMIWAMLGEHAATRTAVEKLRRDVAEALDGSRDALSRVEALLAIDRSRPGATTTVRMPPSRMALARANAGVLAETIIPEDTRRYGPTITFPTVREIYINPRYRLAWRGARSVVMRVTDEVWWSGRPSYEDFDLMLTGHLTSTDATRVPMLLLGHPGAGKSLLMKVLAARLPPEDYTVVRVPLRKVDSNAPLIDQIQQALNLATNRRVEWWQLAEQSWGSVRVVLLDGLDELLQASQQDRSGYLQEVTEFQRLEAEQERPVIVVVTSRTVVADRVSIPADTPIVKLDQFTNDDIANWLARWHRVNAAAIAAGKVPELTPNAVRRQPDLAAHPLLLFMLAVYAADPDLPSLDGDLSTAEFYQRLLEGFTSREAAKDLNRDLRAGEVANRTRDHLERLAVAALAMFNRGRQDIEEETLGRDLSVLDPQLITRTRPMEAGQRIIGEFFFVHAPEARTLTGPETPDAGRAGGNSNQGHHQRTYEFLHATFGEYLVARRVTDEIADIAERVFAGRRGPGIPDDDLAFALLSHQPLAGRRAILDFAEEIFAGLPAGHRGLLSDILELLLGGHRSRLSSGRYAAYQPVPADQVRQLACYSANLVALRAALEPNAGPILLSRLLRTSDSDALQQWKSIVRLWHAGLDASGLQAMLGTVQLTGGPTGPFGIRYESPDGAQMQIAAAIELCRLAGDADTERRLRYGAAIIDSYIYAHPDDTWHDKIASAIIPLIIGRETEIVPEPPPLGTPIEDIESVAELIFCCLRSNLSDPIVYSTLVRLLFDLGGFSRSDPLALAGAVLSEPGLPAEFPELKGSNMFGQYAGIVKKIRNNVLPQDIDLKNPTTETTVAVREIIKRTARPKRSANPWKI